MSLKYPFLDSGIVNAPYMHELEEAAARVIRSGRYIGGPEIDRLEESLCRITGSPNAVAVSNGLDALRLILRAYVLMGRLSPGDEVIVPANTYIASVLAISDAGLVPVLAEPSARTSNLDTDRLDEALSERTAAVMPVHLYGRVCWDEKLREFARSNGLLVIEDAAQAIGASCRCAGMHCVGGRPDYKAGALGDAAAFSFYPTKNVGALGDAGAVTTCDAELAQTMRALANYGSDRRYHNIYRGFNCRMDPIQAAFLNVKLPYMEEENRLRQEIALVYMSEIKNAGIMLPPGPGDGEMSHIYHQFVIHCGHRDALCRHLDANSVGWDLHYAVPPHRQPCYAIPEAGIRAGTADGRLRVTEELADTLLSLPITRCTSPGDAFEIASILNEFHT